MCCLPAQIDHSLLLSGLGTKLQTMAIQTSRAIVTGCRTNVPYLEANAPMVNGKMALSKLFVIRCIVGLQEEIRPLTRPSFPNSHIIRLYLREGWKKPLSTVNLGSEKDGTYCFGRRRVTTDMATG